MPVIETNEGGIVFICDVQPQSESAARLGIVGTLSAIQQALGMLAAAPSIPVGTFTDIPMISPRYKDAPELPELLTASGRRPPRYKQRSLRASKQCGECGRNVSTKRGGVCVNRNCQRFMQKP